MGHDQKSAQKSLWDRGTAPWLCRTGRRNWFPSQKLHQDYTPDLGMGSQQSSRWAKQKLGENTAHAGAAEVQNTALTTCGRLGKLPQHH